MSCNLLQLSPCDLASMQETLAGIFTAICTIEKPGASRDAAGSPVNGWVLVAANVKCRVSAAKQIPRTDVAASKIQTLAAWRIKLPLGTDIGAGYRITVGTDKYICRDANTGETDALQIVAECDRET